MAKLTADFRRAALRRNIVVKTKQNADISPMLYHAASIELANLGFIVSPTVLVGMSVKALEELLADARSLKGADRDMTPIYPGFPKQVEELSTLTLLTEQILHYWTNGAFLPNYPTVAREGLPLEDMLRNARELRVLLAAPAARELIHELVNDPIALSLDDLIALRGAVELQHPTLEEVSRVVKNARNGENIQAFVNEVATTTKLTSASILSAVLPSLSNSDQLLRVLLTLASTPSDEKWEANYELAVETLANRHARAVAMKNISRPVRRIIVEKLGALTKGYNADRLVARADLWRRAMRSVHPYDFNLSVEAKRAADIIHGNIAYSTLNSLIESAMAKGDVKTASKLLSEHQPGNLLRRVVALLRLTTSLKDAQALAAAVAKSTSKSSVTTLISAYNGILSANDEASRVTRVAGLTNTMVNRKAVVKVNEDYLKLVLESLETALVDALAKAPAPKGSVHVEGTVAVPLVRRDAATADRVLDRGQEMAVAGEGDVLRVFGHWKNNQSRNGYMDIGAVILGKDMESLAVSTWNTWSNARDWSVYSGDKNVSPGDSAAEFVDVKLAEVRKKFPKARYVAMTVQSWSGWPIDKVDFIAGAMLRAKADAGEVFDARSVVTAFKPTTQALQAVPFVVDLKTGNLIWLDSSSGSTASGESASDDTAVGSVVYDELVRPRMTMGQLAALWAKAHGAKTVNKPVDRNEVLALLG